MKAMYLPLVPGGESEARMNAILSIKTRMSESHRAALKHIYVDGWPVDLAAGEYGLEPDNVSRNIKKLDELHRAIHEFNIS